MNRLRLQGFATRVLARWSAGWRDVLSAAVAAGASWWLAVHIFGHQQPIFAAVAAIVCLAPGLPNHGLQAANMMIGLALGIVVGETLLVLPPLDDALRISAIAFAAMFAALCFGIAAVIPIQAGVSAIIVLAMGPQIGGEMRLVDAAIGSGIGVLFSQVLFTPDPVEIIDRAAARMLRLLSEGFGQLAAAVTDRDERLASGALAHLFASRESLNALGAGIDLARSTARWSLRGRFAATRIIERAARYDRRAIQLFASTLLLGEAVVTALRSGQAPPHVLGERIGRVAGLCQKLADGTDASEPPRSDPDLAPAPSRTWEASLGLLVAVEEALGSLQETSGRTASSPPELAPQPAGGSGRGA